MFKYKLHMTQADCGVVSYLFGNRDSISLLVRQYTSRFNEAARRNLVLDKVVPPDCVEAVACVYKEDGFIIGISDVGETGVQFWKRVGL